MTYTAQDLVARSWYLSGIVARNLQTPTGDQLTDGLFLLNALLNWQAIQVDLIPYWTYTTLTLVPGQESYFIPNLYEIDMATFNIGVVRYPMDSLGRNQYFGSARVDNISSLPFSWHFLRQVGGGTFYTYFNPAGNYILKYMGKFGLQNVTAQTDMLSVYDPAYVEYLRYALAQYMCSEYGILFNPESEKILNKIIHQLSNVEPPDLTIRKTSILSSIQGSGINYGDVNIGMGYRPS
jgi:hypothetical protein